MELILQSGVGSLPRSRYVNSERLLSKYFTPKLDPRVLKYIKNWFLQASKDIVEAYTAKITARQKENKHVKAILEARVGQIDCALKRYFFDHPELDFSLECLNSLRDFLKEKIYKGNREDDCEKAHKQSISLDLGPRENFENFLKVCDEWGSKRLSEQQLAYDRGEEMSQDEIRKLLFSINKK